MQQNEQQGNPQQHEQTGSAEARGQGRPDQQLPKTEIPEGEKQDIARQAGVGMHDIADIDDLGGRSGRDDSSGGSGDRMEDTSTGEGTDR